MECTVDGPVVTKQLGEQENCLDLECDSFAVNVPGMFWLITYKAASIDFLNILA